MGNVLRKPISHSFFSEIGLKTVISHLFSGYFSYCYPLRSTIFSLYIPCVLLFLRFLFQNPVDVPSGLVRWLLLFATILLVCDIPKRSGWDVLPDTLELMPVVVQM